jgi:hypothetical protein
MSELAVAELGVVEPGMVVSDGAGGEIGEEIEDGAATPRVEEPGAFRPGKVHDHVVAVGEHVPGENAVDFAGLDVDAPVRDGGNRHRELL